MTGTALLTRPAANDRKGRSMAAPAHTRPRTLTPEAWQAIADSPVLARPTIGALRRARGLAEPTSASRHALAVDVVHEASRQAAAVQLEGVFVALNRQHDIAKIGDRLVHLGQQLRRIGRSATTERQGMAA